MKQTVNYDNQQLTETQKRDKVITDARFYNPEAMKKIEAACKTGEIKDYTTLAICMEFSGIQGYPVRCIAELYNIPIPTKKG